MRWGMGVDVVVFVGCFWIGKRVGVYGFWGVCIGFVGCGGWFDGNWVILDGWI